MEQGEGFRFEPEALYGYCDASTGLVSMVSDAHSGLTSMGALPAGMFGEVGQSSGFVAAFTERAVAIATHAQAAGAGMEQLAGAVRGYVDAKMRDEDDHARDIATAGEPA